jgi:hypothetical protein
MRKAYSYQRFSSIKQKGGERSDSIVIAHDDDLDGIFEDTKSNWFNVESKDMAEIGSNLQMLASKLR